MECRCRCNSRMRLWLRNKSAENVLCSSIVLQIESGYQLYDLLRRYENCFVANGSSRAIHSIFVLI